MELALVYLVSSGTLQMNENLVLETVPPAPLDTKDIKELDVNIVNEKEAAWLATYCAALTAQAQRARRALAGELDTVLQKIGAAVAEVPDFIALDLVGSCVIGERKKVYKDEIAEELAPLTDTLEPPVPDTYEDQVRRSKETTADVNWLTFIGYQSVLEVLCSTSAVNRVPLVSTIDTMQRCVFTPLNVDNTATCGILRTTLLSGPWQLRIAHVQRYLVKFLPNYADKCTAIYPPLGLELPLPDGIPNTSIDLDIKSYAANRVETSDGLLARESGPGLSEAILARSGNVNVTGDAIYVNWYQPLLDQRVMKRLDDESSDEVGKYIMMILAVVSKKTKMRWCKMNWVSLSRLTAIHNSVIGLIEKWDLQAPIEFFRELDAFAKKPLQIPTTVSDMSDPVDLSLQVCVSNAMTELNIALPPTETPPPEQIKIKKRSSSVIGVFTDTSESLHIVSDVFDPVSSVVVDDLQIAPWFISKLAP